MASTHALTQRSSRATGAMGVRLALMLLGLCAVLSASCVETAECDENNPCGSGRLCFRKFCHSTCSTATESVEVQREECGASQDSDVICRTCSGECEDGEGQVCVNSTRCEPKCECEDCCVNGTCIDPPS